MAFPLTEAEINSRFAAAIDAFWEARAAQKQKQVEHGRIDAGNRGAVTGGSQMGALEVLITDIICASGIDRACIKSRTAIEIPGYFRPEKKWDLLVVVKEQLVAAIEFKSMVGSEGKNINNRVEEAVGSATDFWTAYREGRLGTGPRPFLGYFMLLQDAPAVHKPTRPREPYFQIDPVFKNTSYAQRYEIMCRRFILERLYDSACLTLSTADSPRTFGCPAEDIAFDRFVRDLRAQMVKFG